MPTAFVNKIADKHGVSISKLEKIWNEVKAGIKKSGRSESDSRFFGLVTSVFKQKVKADLGITVEGFNTHFKHFLIIQKFLLEKEQKSYTEKNNLKVGKRVRVETSKFRSGRDPGRRSANPTTGVIRKMGERGVVVSFDKSFVVKGKKVREMTVPFNYITPLEEDD